MPALLANKMIGMVPIKNKEVTEVKPEDLFEVGTSAYILKMLKMPAQQHPPADPGNFPDPGDGEFTQSGAFLRVPK